MSGLKPFGVCFSFFRLLSEALVWPPMDRRRIFSHYSCWEGASWSMGSIFFSSLTQAFLSLCPPPVFPQTSLTSYFSLIESSAENFSQRRGAFFFFFQASLFPPPPFFHSEPVRPYRAGFRCFETGPRSHTSPLSSLFRNVSLAQFAQ